jgi:hypothetical protein
MKDPIKTAGWGVFLVLGVYYFVNRYPGPAFIDSGELALCADVFGVPHPTGYPLYLVLSVLAAFFFSRPIIAVTILSGIITAFAGMAYYRLGDDLRRHVLPDSSPYLIATVALALVLFLAPVVAEQGTTNEVYGLAFLLGLLILYAMFKALTADNSGRGEQYLILTWYVQGLALCDHMNAIQFLPALAILTVVCLRRRFSWKTIAAIIPAFVVPLTLYAVLPIRASATPPPVANWGDVTTWPNFFRHVSGWQFKIWFLSGGAGQLWSNIKIFFSMLWQQYPWPVFLLLPFGIAVVFRRSTMFGIVLVITVFVNIFLGINYTIPDIESYYLQTIATVALFSFMGLVWLGSIIRARYLISAVAVGLLAWQVIAVWQVNYKGDYTLPEDYARNIMRSADYGAVVVSQIWDRQGQAFYLQQAEYNRPDLKFIDKELLRRSWYYRTIERVYPDLYAKIADLLPEFLSELAKFESGKKFDPEKLEYYYQSIINRLLTEVGTSYIDYQLDYRPMSDQYLRPQGLLFRVDTIAINMPLPQPELIWRGRPLDKYTDWRARENLKMVEAMLGKL